MATKEALQQKIEALEQEMYSPTFWSDKVRAQAVLKELESLKIERDNGSLLGGKPALMTIFAGVGGDDAEDFVAMLLRMYQAYIETQTLSYTIVSSSENDRGGYRSVSMQIDGKGAYGTLEHESGVHRLVRISPFNAQGKRQTSFAMVEVVPLVDDPGFILDEKDLHIDFAKSGGPGGQNVNKRETAVRITHIPTNITVHAQSERNQEGNRQKALQLLKAKLLKKYEEDKLRNAEGLQISKTVEIEWGNQIRSYVLHPYKLVKDHRTEVETSDVEGVLKDGNIQLFIDAFKKER